MKTRNSVFSPFWILLGGILTILACSSCQSDSSLPTPTKVSFFIAPTAGAEMVSADSSAQEPTQTPRSNCSNKLTFIRDITIPDGTEVSPGQTVTKRWLVENSGSCDWQSAYQLLLISGLKLGASETQHLYPARRSTRAVLEIVFTAPDSPGRYNTWWQAADPSGNRFGDPFYMDLVVSD
jgi:hypothetical protein